MPGKPEPSGGAILAAAAKLQRIVPDAVLVGGTHGWVTARVSRPVMVLGSLDGVETGIRNLIRLRPLEVEVFPTPEGPVRVPTLAEMARIKAWLVLKRNATRDYLDLVALLDRLGPSGPRVLVDLDTWYADQIGTDGERVATQLAKQLAEPKPYDLSDIDLGRYRRLDKRWHDWSTVAETCRVRAGEMLALLLERGDFSDWRPLVRAIAADPFGPLAEKVLHICDVHPMYGTSPLWRTWIASVRARAAADPAG